ncbi:MAG: ATP-dependent Clp protease proteolytic subunit [bacterium]|nr:ATP-dependent Clp protease proteolytic subunit [bacterium]
MIHKSPKFNDTATFDGDEPESSPSGDVLGKMDSDVEQRSRNIYLFKEFDAKTSQIAISNLLALEEENPEKDIFLYINSYGGSVIDLLAIIDCIDNLACDVWTIGIGVCASSGAVLLASGSPGKRYCYEHTRILLHEVSNSVKGTVSDLDIRIQETRILQNILYEVMSKRTGQPLDKIESDLKKDYWMSSEEAIKYGLIDYVLHGFEHKQKLKEQKRKNSNKIIAKKTA